MRRKRAHPAPEDIHLTQIMAALSDPIRVGLLRVLSDGVERGWGDLQAPVAKSTQSHHLSVLRDAGLVHTREEGTRCYVALRREDVDARFPRLLDAVLEAAENDRTGEHVRLREAM